MLTAIPAAATWFSAGDCGLGAATAIRLGGVSEAPNGHAGLVAVEELDEAHEDAGAPLRVRGGSVGLRCLGHRHGAVDLGARDERDMRLHLAGGGVEHLRLPAAALRLRPVDPMPDVGQASLTCASRARAAPIIKPMSTPAATKA